MAVATRPKTRRTPAAERTGEAGPKVKKHRVLDARGKWQWVPITETSVPPFSPQAQIITDVSAPARGVQFDWDGNELEPWDGEYDDYVQSMPPREQLRPFKEPHCYWETEHPGTALHPYPRMGAFRSLQSGVWECRNEAQEIAVREYLTQSTGLDPDTLRITADELAIMNGSTPGPIHYCQAGACHFVSCSMIANTLHETLNSGHFFKTTPRAD